MKRLVFFLLFASCIALVSCGGNSTSSGQSFKFVVFGDSRVPAYDPYTKADESKINDLVGTFLTDIYGQQKLPYEIQFNPYTGHVEMIRIGTETQYQLTFYKNDWPDMIYAFNNGYGIVQLRHAGQQWVYDSVVDAVRKDAEFVLHNGDITYWGYQGVGLDVNPYWQDFVNRFLSRLPSSKPRGLVGRFFPSVGNHETWYDADILGFRQTFPYLAQLGFSSNNRTYSFDYKNSRFIFLYSGSFPDTAQGTKETRWTSTQPDFKTQMTWLEAKLVDAKAKGLKHIFVTYHFPSFTLAEEPPLPLDADNNPHLTLKKYSRDLDIVVFNGHVHTTEIFMADGVRYLNVGGGGGEQEYAANPGQSPYPELYWNGSPRVEEYNYFEIRVDGDTVHFFVHRWRPDSPTPYQAVELFTGS